MSRLATIWALGIAVVALAVSIVALTRPTGTPGKSVTEAAVAYIQDVANQNSLRIQNEKVLAYRVNDTDAVVRVKIEYQPYFQVGPGRRLYGPSSIVTLVVKLHKGLWTAGSVTAAP